MSADAAGARQHVTSARYDLGAQLPAVAADAFSAAEGRNLSCGWDWFSLLRREVFGAATPSCVLAVERNGHCVVALPVVGGERPGALVNYYSSYFAPVVDVAASVGQHEWLALAQQLRAWQPEVVSWHFAPLDPALPTTVAWRQALKSAGYAAFPYFRFGNWYLPCAGVPWAQYLASRPGALRTTLQRMGRRFERDGGRLEIIRDPVRCEAGLVAYERVYAASWKQSEPFPEFIRGLVRLAARNGWLRLGVAWVDERPLAAQIWLTAHGRAEIFKLAYDEQANRHSAGTLLTAALMQEALDVDKVLEVDYLMGDDAYKQTWMTHRRERWGLLAVDLRRPLGWWLTFLQWASQTASRLIRPRRRP